MSNSHAKDNISTSTQYRRALTWIVVFVMATVVLVQIQAPAAQAYNQNWAEPGATVLCGDLDESQFVFAADAEWTNNMKTKFEEGFDAWVYDIEDYNGGYLLDEDGIVWTARWDDIGSDTAKTTCYPWLHNIEFSDSLYLSFEQGGHKMESVSAHEWGHAFGLGHVGKQDTLGSEGSPTMATCLSPGDTDRETLSRDDEAAIISANESVGGYKTATANASFEENESSHKGYWFTQNLNYFTASSSGGGVDGSPWYAKFRAIPGVTNGALYNDTYVTADHGENYKGRANYKKNSSTDYGTVKVTMKTRKFEHYNDGGCGGDNINVTSYVSGWVAKNKTCTPSSSWGYCTTSVLSVSGWGTAVHHARIVIYNRMQWNLDGGTNTFVKTDRTRVMLDGISG